MRGKAYLGRTMLARFLACFALLSGLAAVGTPVNASLLATASEQVESDSQAPNQAKIAVSTCASQRNAGRTAEQAERKCRERRPVTVYIPTVQLGADRAYE